MNMKSTKHTAIYLALTSVLAVTAAPVLAQTSGNTAYGEDALEDNDTGRFNTAIGSSALKANHTGSFNSAFGSSALTANENGNFNIAIGSFALESTVRERGRPRIKFAGVG